MNANGYDDTVRMSHHARERCAEMGISTKVAKAIVRDFDVVRGDGERGRIYVSDRYPDYAVVVGEDGVVVTVLFRTYDDYDRDGPAWKPR